VPSTSAIVPTSRAVAEPPATPAAAAPQALSRTPKFAPWLRQLEGQLLDLGIQVVRETTGERLEEGAEDRDDGDDAIDEIRSEQRREVEVSRSEHMEGMRRLGGSLGKLMQLIHNELVPRLPNDPEALFLAASADFISRRFDTGLRLMQTSMMATADGHCTNKQLAARHYFVAILAIRIITEADKGQKEDGVGKMVIELPTERYDELLGVTERGLREALRLDPKLHSAYIDCTCRDPRAATRVRERAASPLKITRRGSAVAHCTSRLFHRPLLPAPSPPRALSCPLVPTPSRAHALCVPRPLLTLGRSRSRSRASQRRCSRSCASRATHTGASPSMPSSSSPRAPRASSGSRRCSGRCTFTRS
jgi:hypothetical protein